VKLVPASIVVKMARSRCIQSFTVSTLLISVIIVFQLFLFEDSKSDADSFLREQNIITPDVADEHTWNRWAMLESISLMCLNCSFKNVSRFNLNRTSGNDTEHVHDAVYSYLHQFVRRLNHAPVVRNLDKFDIPADNEGSLVIVVQVQICLCILVLIMGVLFALFICWHFPVYCTNTSFESFAIWNFTSL